jgi:threonine dehydratase
LVSPPDRGERLVTLEEVRAARETIGARLHRTPLVASSYLSKRTASRVWLKLELFQKTGSFKPRGVLTALAALTADERNAGVVSLSAGNHAQALAWAATASGIHSTIVMPAAASPTKVAATRDYGGEVVQTEADLLATARELEQQRHLTLVHPFDDLGIIAGQGTVGLEIVEDLPEVDVVLVGCGGGGLLAGVAAAVKRTRPDARVIGIEPTGASAMKQSVARGTPVRLERLDTIADGLAAPFAGAHTLRHVQAFVDEMITVEDSEIVEGMKVLMQRCKILPEPAGAAATAALLAGRLTIDADANVVSIVSGGNIDLGRLRGML